MNDTTTRVPVEATKRGVTRSIMVTLGAGVEMVDIDKLKPNPKNPIKHTEADISATANSITKEPRWPSNRHSPPTS